MASCRVERWIIGLEMYVMQKGSSVCGVMLQSMRNLGIGL